MAYWTPVRSRWAARRERNTDLREHLQKNRK